MNDEKWDLIIGSKTKFLNFNFKELYLYRDLIYMFVKRDFVIFYKQTILGPLWYVIQPIITSIVFTIIFGKLANIPTDESPPFLFYMCGVVAWGYFATCLSLTSNTFAKNNEIFGKVYFPRLVVPIANAIIALFQFFIQFIIFLFFYFYYYLSGIETSINFFIFFLPLVIFQMALLGLGFGILISALTTKYRDLTFVMSFAVQLWMFATPIVYPLSIIPEKYKIFSALNPMTSVVEIFKLSFFGSSSIEFIHIFLSILITLMIFLFGLFLFGRMEKNFMDTI